MISWSWVDGTLLVGTYSSDEASKGKSFDTKTRLKVASFDLVRYLISIPLRSKLFMQICTGLYTYRDEVRKVTCKRLG
jgi:hypothetical protein